MNVHVSAHKCAEKGCISIKHEGPFASTKRSSIRFYAERKLARGTFIHVTIEKYSLELEVHRGIYVCTTTLAYQINKMRAGSSKGFGLTKGAWTTQEDILLKNCIEKYGEGKWHLVPLKAGLNRCRKSCRLRWLNYLRPNIKRGEFGEDEVDLMFRLHKLLGNRWSLIAGRIPGRTANDVKNYWNTHVHSRSKKQKKESDEEKLLQHITVKIIKPQPQTFSKTLDLYMGDNRHIKTQGYSSLIRSSDDAKNFNISPGLISSPNTLDDNTNEYLEDLFNDNEKKNLGKNEWLYGGSSVVGEPFNVAELEHDRNHMSDFEMDEAIWNLIDSDQL